MAGEALSLHINFNHIPNLLRGLPTAVALELDRVASRIEQQSKANAPVRTGALRASGFRITPVYNDYSSAVSGALRCNPRVHFGMPPATYARDTATIGHAVDYAQAVHDGSRGRPANPFLWQAATAQQRRSDTQLLDAINHLAAGGAA